MCDTLFGAKGEKGFEVVDVAWKWVYSSLARISHRGCSGKPPFLA
jgi:hypothetical protein